MWGLFKPMRGRYKRGRDACLLKHRKDLFHPRGTTMVFPCSDMDTWCPWNCDVHRRTSSSFMAPEHFSPSETWISPMFHHCCISERKRHYLLSHCWDHEKLSVLFRHLACFHALAMMEKWEMFSAWMVTGVSSPQSWACLSSRFLYTTRSWNWTARLQCQDQLGSRACWCLPPWGYYYLQTI